MRNLLKLQKRKVIPACQVSSAVLQPYSTSSLKKNFKIIVDKNNIHVIIVNVEVAKTYIII